MPARLHVAAPLVDGAEFNLPDGAARHVQVLRLQPGAALTLFDGSGAEWPADVVQMTRHAVVVRTGARREVDRELALNVTLALGVPTNERMDAVVEKATELGVAAIQPLLCERSVLRLAGERADKRREHWQAVAIAACEQSGRNRVPHEARWLLSTSETTPLHARADHPAMTAVLALSGPEGGLSPAEEDSARERAFESISLGPRVLRADTAPLALLAYLGLNAC
jgi:16S rRNA (uracil1498-N3)-methyltransferase